MKRVIKLSFSLLLSVGYITTIFADKVSFLGTTYNVSKGIAQQVGAEIAQFNQIPICATTQKGCEAQRLIHFLASHHSRKELAFDYACEVLSHYSMACRSGLVAGAIAGAFVGSGFASKIVSKAYNITKNVINCAYKNKLKVVIALCAISAFAMYERTDLMHMIHKELNVLKEMRDFVLSNIHVIPVDKDTFATFAIPFVGSFSSFAIVTLAIRNCFNKVCRKKELAH